MLQRTLLNPDVRIPRAASADDIERLREYSIDPDTVSLLQQHGLVPDTGFDLHGHHYKDFLLEPDEADRVLLRIPASRDVPKPAKLDQRDYLKLAGRNKQAFDEARKTQLQVARSAGSVCIIKS